MVLINPYNGIVELARVFDTYKSCGAFEAFIDKEIPRGYIICAACMDDCASNLSENAKRWFEMFGSKEIRNIKYR